MATQTALQVIPSSADLPGLSVLTASRTQKSSRAGIIYNPTTLAAAQPVWFQAIDDGHYLGVFSQRLTDATLSPTAVDGLLAYTTYTTSLAPSWAVLGPETGTVRDIADIPSEMPGIRTLVAASGVGSYLFLLNRYQKQAGADTTYALLQNFRVTGRDGISLLGEELIPRDLALGLYTDRRYLWVFGDDGKGKLAMARKNWGRIGSNYDINPVMGWQYWGQGSWNTNPDYLGPLLDYNGAGIPAQGTCSMSRYRDTYYLMTTARTTYPVTVPAPIVPATTVPVPGTVTVTSQMKIIINRISSILGGVVNGFFNIGTGVISAITSLVDRATTLITGRPGTVNSTVRGLVEDFLEAFTGATAIVTDPASIFQNLVKTITGIPVIGGVITLAQNLIQGLSSAVLNTVTGIVGTAPFVFLEDLIRNITGILTGVGNVTTTPLVPIVTTSFTNTTVNLTPQSSWDAKVYTNRKAQQSWLTHPFTEKIAATTATYLDGGVFLQEQIPTTPGYGVTTTSAEVTALDEYSHPIQVFTGTSPHTVILPPTGKPTGTTITTEGVVIEPPTPASGVPVTYMGYTVHNQSTSDIVVMASERDKQIVVPRGSGTTFTPYTTEPTTAQNWSWTHATDRAPRLRQGFPYLSSHKLFVNTYLLLVSGSPTSGLFRFAHNGRVTSGIAYQPDSETTTNSNIQNALLALPSVDSVTVLSNSATSFSITITDDPARLEVYDYRLINGTSPTVVVSQTNSISTVVTQWGIFEPEPMTAEPSGITKALVKKPVQVPATTLPTGLVGLLEQFSKLVSSVSAGLILVGTGVVETVTGIVGDAVYLLTGDALDNINKDIQGLVTEFLQELSRSGTTVTAANSFENILRQITGGTGTIGYEDVPTPLQFVGSVVDAAEDVMEGLADWLQKIVNAITNK